MVARLSLSTFIEYTQSLEQDAPTWINRLADITSGRVAPAVDSISIGSARLVSAAVIFFDIRGFTQRTSSAQVDDLKGTLFMLNCVIPAMMRVLFRHEAYVEKNTGDGLMAILGVGGDAHAVAQDALSACSEMMFVLHQIVNPFLTRNGIAPVDARIGVDMGQILLARIGMPRGTASHDRSSLTAVGPAANIASKLQGLAGTNEIYCGDRLRQLSGWLDQAALFYDMTPANWSWVYVDTGGRYSAWKYVGRTLNPYSTILGRA